MEKETVIKGFFYGCEDNDIKIVEAYDYLKKNGLTLVKDFAWMDYQNDKYIAVLNFVQNTPIEITFELTQKSVHNMINNLTADLVLFIKDYFSASTVTSADYKICVNDKYTCDIRDFDSYLDILSHLRADLANK